jgi:hypothetical protein
VRSHCGQARRQCARPPGLHVQMIIYEARQRRLRVQGYSSSEGLDFVRLGFVFGLRRTRSLILRSTSLTSGRVWSFFLAIAKLLRLARPVGTFGIGL